MPTMTASRVMRRLMPRLFPRLARRRSAPRRAAVFGSNPGGLEMRVHAPRRLAAGRPLVVVLHGCGQNAATFAAEAGWTAIAQEYRLALLLPEQTAENNQGRCFNWFRPEDVGRGLGEAMSIRQMIRHAVARFGSDPRRIFVVGFSAGGVVAGMPVGCAQNAMGALLQMRRADGFRTRAGLADNVRRVARADARGPVRWPRLSIWQGVRDRTVDPANAEMLAAQWSELHGHGVAPSVDRTAAGVRWRAWGRADRPSVDLWTVDALGHAFPIDAAVDGGAHAGAWVADAGVSAARQIAAFWGLDRPVRRGLTLTGTPA